MSSSPRGPTARRPRPGHRSGQEGFALILALIVTMTLALIVAGAAQVILADQDMGQLTRWDATALYLALAAAEQQIYVLKGNKDGGAVPDTNYPVTADRRFWYSTSLASPDGCLLNCTGNVSSRRWRIRATGEIRQYNPDSTWTVVQSRTILAEVDITYAGTSPTYGTPLQVTIRRWEEALP
jgi:Tfp pilus assembly protein PilV